MVSDLTNSNADTSEHQQIFSLCLQGKVEELKKALQSAQAHSLRPRPLQPSACIAAQRGSLDILHFCLNEGAKFDKYLTRAAQMGARNNLPFLEFLLAQNWANIQRSPEAVIKQIEHYGEDSMEAVWLRRHAGGGLKVEQVGGKTKTKLKSQPEETEGPKQRPTDEDLDWFDRNVKW